MVSVTVGNGFWEPDKHKIRRGARQGSPKWDHFSSAQTNKQHLVYEHCSCFCCWLMLCAIWNPNCAMAVLTYKDWCIFLLIYDAPPNLPWKCFVRGKLVIMCVFETHTSEKRRSNMFQGLTKYLIFQSQATPKVWWKITMEQKMHAKSK